MQATPLQEVRAHLDAGDFHAAWLCSSETPEGERHRARAEILYRAGDPAGAFAEAEVGLTRSPEDLDLLFYASAASLWLEDGVAAEAYSRQLSMALERGAASLDERTRAAWNHTAAEHAKQARTIQQHEAARQGALSRFRAVSIVLLAAALLAVAWASRSTQGRSSRPVS